MKLALFDLDNTLHDCSKAIFKAIDGAMANAVAATLNLDQDAANALLNRSLGAETIDRAATLAAEAANPKSDHRGSADYKRHVVDIFVRRILAGLADQTERAA